ncbi:MAG: tetratricopeptide repeat protein [Bacteroidota bacterium]
MRVLFRIVYIGCCIVLYCSGAAAQQWPSPDVEQLHVHAQEYMARGNYVGAIKDYRHAIALAPKEQLLHRELGRAQYMAGSYEEAAKTLRGAIGLAGTEAGTYQLLAISEERQGHTKAAQRVLADGLAKFSTSGLLHYERGRILYNGADDEGALNAWLDGIQKEPAHAANYYEAARVYLGSSRVAWGLIYGETYLAMRHDTANDTTMKRLLFAGWHKVFEQLPLMRSDDPQGFEATLLNELLVLSPVVSDGISTENLAMLRARLAMQWQRGAGSKYPLSIINWWDGLMGDGWFDIYTEWAYGSAENEREYAAWNTFHEGEIAKWQEWLGAHPLVPAAGFYNDRNMVGLWKRGKGRHSKR